MSAPQSPTVEAARERAATMLEWQSHACASLGSPLYAELLARAAADTRAGGPCADALAGYEDAPGPDAVALRLMGGVHALVLTGRAPRLAAYYASVGGEYDPGRAEDCWAAFRATVGAELPRVREWMTRPPQTNEVGRASLLLTGLLWAARSAPLPVRLFELGSSAGLNLRPERFRVSADGFAWGPVDSPVQLADAWRGGPPAWLVEAGAEQPELTVVERRGCDLTPIDPLSEAGALALHAYVWADQGARFARLDGAVRLAAADPAAAEAVEAVGAAEFLAGVGLRAGTLTVVWHSIMRQYVQAEEWARVDAELARLAAASTPEAPFAYIAFEPERVGEDWPCLLSVRQGGAERRVLAEAKPHGLPAWVAVRGV
ncbi:DUF2332 domain-containing protein [Streptacidiphilus carbonis]|uniref:DUF2332 domain-containing protein n=1 Tax=Streptacidiphilus carbonis TaxID=105422 RepID=UPI00069452F2|nr:DUF2332 domain-containing protein [Streptacidiphilus carbonis]